MCSLYLLTIAICSLSTLTHALFLARGLYQQGVLHVRFLRVVMACVFDPLLPCVCLHASCHTLFLDSIVSFSFSLSFIYLFLELLSYFHYYFILRVEVLGLSHFNFGSIIYIWDMYIYIYIYTYIYIYIYIEDNKYYLNNIMEKVIPKSKTKFLQNYIIYIYLYIYIYIYIYIL